MKPPSSQFTELGHLDLGQESARLSIPFTFSEKFAQFEIVIPDGKGDSREVYDSPQTELILLFTINTLPDNVRLIDQVINSDNLIYNNWHLPNTSMRIDNDRFVRKNLEVGKTYLLTLRVLKPSIEWKSGSLVIEEIVMVNRD